MAACEIANARVFIESEELEHAIEDNVKSLKEAMESPIYQTDLIKELGEEDFNEKLEILTKLEAKESKEGKFKPSDDEMDPRTPE